MESDTTRYYLCGDDDINPASSLGIVFVVDSGLLIDIGREWAVEGEEDDSCSFWKIFFAPLCISLSCT